jgi:hypothetical protein
VKSVNDPTSLLHRAGETVYAANVNIDDVESKLAELRARGKRVRAMVYFYDAAYTDEDFVGRGGGWDVLGAYLTHEDEDKDPADELLMALRSYGLMTGGMRVAVAEYSDGDGDYRVYEPATDCQIDIIADKRE